MARTRTFLSRRLRSIQAAACVAVVVVLLAPGAARATFSIVAVDPVTGAVGSAGASCIAGAQIIERVIESIGAMNTQAYWNAANQARGDSMMRAGDPPDSIIRYLVAHDSQDDGLTAADRQYGAVTLAGPGASASHTGTGNSYWAGARTGPGYSLQGNILLDSTVVEDMETAFLTTAGPLEDRLMAALEAAKVRGADVRCYDLNKSSISAFIKVVYPGDGETPFLYEVVSNTGPEVDPIDVLRDRFDAWRFAQLVDPELSTVVALPAALPATGKDTAVILVTPRNGNGETPTEGVSVSCVHTGTGTLLGVVDNGDGTFADRLVSGTLAGKDTVRVTTVAGGQTLTLTTVPVIPYFLCGDVNESGVVTSADIIYLVNHVFKSGPAPSPDPAAGDVNRSGQLTSADIIYLVVYVFKSGPAPCP